MIRSESLNSFGNTDYYSLLQYSSEGKLIRIEKYNYYGGLLETYLYSGNCD